jgi:hypothetical protein
MCKGDVMEGIMQNGAFASFKNLFGRIPEITKTHRRGSGKTSLYSHERIATKRIRLVVRFCGMRDIFRFREDVGQLHYVKVTDRLCQPVNNDPQPIGVAHGLHKFCDVKMFHKICSKHVARPNPL